MVFSLTMAAVFAQTAAAPVTLKHVFQKDLKSEYSVNADLQIEARGGILTTFLPEDHRFSYTFFTKTVNVDHDIASMRYARPTMSETGSATADADPETRVIKTNILQMLQMSQINEVLDNKDLNPKKKEPKEKSFIRGARLKGAVQDSIEDLFVPFVSDLETLSMFLGGLDSSLDLEPKFDIGPVKVGDTWKRTVSYQPQKLASKSGKMAVQRLDLTYTYKGLVESNGKQFQHIHAEITLNSDLATYVNELFNVTADRTGLKSIPTTLNLKMEFDLDPKTLQTISASVKSVGGFKIFVPNNPQAVQEQNFHGTSEMHLVSNKIVAEPPAKL